MTVRSEIELLTQTREEIRTAIVDQGQTLDTTAPMNPDFGDKIRMIPNSSTGVEHYTLKEVLEGTAETVSDNTIDYIRPYCFSGCDNLKSASFSSVLKIEQHAFDSCFCFKSLILNTDYMVHLVNINAFKETSLGKRRGSIHVKESLQDTYRANKYWKHYSLNIKSIVCAGVNPLGYLKANASDASACKCVDLGWSSVTDFTGATATNANLTNANFCDATATNANLTNVNMENCDLYKCNLSGANLTGTNLSNAVLVGADISNSTCLAGQNLAGLTYGVHFLVESNTLVFIGNYALTYLKANGANTSGTKVNSNTKVTLTTLVNTSTNLTNANLAGANLKGTKMTSTNLTSANLTNANYEKADLNGWNLSSKDLNGTTWRTLQYQSVNTTVVGGPARNAGGFWIKNFSTTNYLTLPSVFSPGTNTWEMKLRIKTPATFTEKRIIGNYTTDLNAGMVLGFDTTGKLDLWLTSDNSSWNVATSASGPLGTVALAANTNYYIRMRFTGTQYILDSSTDNSTWTTHYTLNSTVAIKQTVPFSIGMYTGTGAYEGLVDLANCYIKVNDAYWWRGVTHLLTTSDRNNVNANKKFEIQQIRRSTTVVVHRQIGDIICTWKQPVLTENGTLMGSVFALTSSSDYNATYAGYRVFNNNTGHGTCWASASGATNPTLTWYNPLPIKISNINVMNRVSGANTIGAPLTGTISGSNDNSTYTQIKSWTNTNTAAGSATNTWNISMTGDFYKCHKLIIATFNSTTYTCIQQLNLTATCKL